VVVEEVLTKMLLHMLFVMDSLVGQVVVLETKHQEVLDLVVMQIK
jgi:hypothetical protein